MVLHQLQFINLTFHLLKIYKPIGLIAPPKI